MTGSPAALIDDHLLLHVLLHDEPVDIGQGDARLFTTGLWHHRLCRALTVPAVTGTLSRSIGGVDAAVAAAAIGAITALPEDIGLLSMRTLAWPMATLLADGARLNLLSLEALAAAILLDAEIYLASVDANPTLIDAAMEHDVAVWLIDIS